MAFNNTVKNLALDSLDESIAAGIKYIGIHQVADPGTGLTATGTEATGGSPVYARQAVTWGAASAGQKSNTAALTFDVPAGTYGHFSLWNTLTLNSGTQYMGYVPFGGASALKGFFSADPVLTTDNLFSVAHGMSDGDRVILYTVFSETLPTGTGLTAGAALYVVNSTANTFKVSTTSGGTAIDITAVGGGEGYWQRVVPEVFAAQGQIIVAIGALVLDATAF